MANNESEKIIAEQKAEIERLTEENEFARKILSCSKRKTRIGDLVKEKTELQKQVDELTAKREVGREKLKNEIATKIFMGCSYSVIACGKMTIERAKLEAEQYIEFAWDMVQQAVKDTAKEILQEGKYCLSKSLQEWIKERYGVEVE